MSEDSGRYREESELSSIERISEELRKRGLTISVAESCTGGMLGAELTKLPGSSDIFLGGAVVYCNTSKEKILNVSPSTLTKHGAVSVETAKEMAIGTKRAFGSDISLSITGIAGPGGATVSKPVGLVYIGLSYSGDTIAKEFRFDGDRNEIRRSAVHSALEMLDEYLRIH